MRRHVRQIRFRDFDEITEDGIEAHFQRLDSGLGDFALLQGVDPVLSVARGIPKLIKLRIKAISKNSALFQRQRGIVHQRALQLRCQLWHFRDLILKTLGQRYREFWCLLWWPCRLRLRRRHKRHACLYSRTCLTEIDSLDQLAE